MLSMGSANSAPVATTERNPSSTGTSAKGETVPYFLILFLSEMIGNRTVNACCLSDYVLLYTVLESIGE